MKGNLRQLVPSEYFERMFNRRAPWPACALQDRNGTSNKIMDHHYSLNSESKGLLRKTEWQQNTMNATLVLAIGDSTFWKQKMQKIK